MCSILFIAKGPDGGEEVLILALMSMVAVRRLKVVDGDSSKSGPG